MNHKKRTTEEYIILSISGASAVCIFPFFIIRALNNDWAVATLDLFAVISTAIVFAYVYSTSKVKGAYFFQAFLCIVVVVGTIVIKGSQQVAWIYPSLIGLFFLLPAKIALMLALALSASIGLFLAYSLNYLQLIQYALSTLITVLFSFAFADRMFRQQTLLRELSIKDPLTGACNRRAMEEKLLKITDVPPQKNGSLPSLILIDLDEFKKTNEKYGHSAGDNILREFSNITSNQLSEHESLYRFGGEEFVIICSHLDCQQASLLAEDIREIIDNHHFENGIRITISLGIAEYKINETSFEWLGRADKAMYRAKHAGRNLCFISG